MHIEAKLPVQHFQNALLKYIIIIIVNAIYRQAVDGARISSRPDGDVTGS